MSARKPQSRRTAETCRASLASRAAAMLAGLAALVWAPLAMGDPATPDPVPEGSEVLGFEIPLGRIDYRAGRGLRLGETGFTIGGFATAEAERLEDGSSFGGIDSANFFFVFDPVPFLHIFSEIETSRLISAQNDSQGVDSRPSVNVERLHGDLTAADFATLRLGKFQTPLGRWNQVRIEPLLWTASDPLIVEEIFDDIATGAMLFGNLFPGRGVFTYSLYGTFFDPIAPDRDAPPAEHSSGARFEWTGDDGSGVGASYFASKRRGESWNHLGGVDGVWRPHDRLELSTEAIFGEGTQDEGHQWGLYAQAVIETLPNLFLVGRYEHLNPPDGSRAMLLMPTDPAIDSTIGSAIDDEPTTGEVDGIGDEHLVPPNEARGIDLFVLGFVWAPFDFVRIKADYRFADHGGERAAPGLRSSFSILF